MALKKANGSYTASDIIVHDDISGVRSNLGMYLGGNDSQAIFQAAKEIFDNGRDEIQAGHNNIVTFIVDKDRLIVADEGRGIPVDTHTKTKRPVIIDVLSKLHAGGKNKGNLAYATGSAGVHGVGAAVVNFVSEYFEAYSYRKEKGGWNYVRFDKGRLSINLTKKRPPLIAGKKFIKGTVIVFKLDPECFSKKAKLDLKQVHQYIKIQSYLYPQGKFVVNVDGEDTVYQQKGGLSDYIHDLLEREKAEPQGKEVIIQQPGLAFALQWSDAADETIMSYVNGSHTKDHGTHYKGLIDAITKALEPFKAKKDYTPTDLRTGLIGVLNVEFSAPKFDSQTKGRLVSEEAYELVYTPTLAALTAFFAKNKNLANDIIRRAAEVRELRTAFQANKKATAALRSTKARASLPAKLLSSTTKNPKERELYIVEGDSAGGTAKHARDGRYQEVLKLRGKILNAYGPQGHKVFDTEKDRNEVLDIMRAIGYDGDPTKPLKLRVGKILILTDPDPDGKHIALLIANLFQKTLPKAIIDKYLYIVKAPLFMYSFNENKKVFGDTVEDVRKKLGKTKLDPKKLTRIKGFGEVNPNVLKQVAFDPKSPDRHIVRITELKQGKEAEFLEIVGEKAHGRRQLLGL